MSAPQSLRALPKVQLHCHLEGTVRAGTFRELAARYGVSTTYRPDGAQNDARGEPHEGDDYAFKSFHEFLFTFAAVCRSLRQPDDYVRILREYANDAARNGVIYAEVFVSPSVWRFFHPDLDLEDVFARLYAATEEIESATSIPIRFICDLTRNFGARDAMKTAHLAVDMRKYGVISVGLGGDEANFPPNLFEQPFAYARAHGLHTVAHAGEAAGAQSVHDAVTVLGAKRIGHGIRALESPAVLELLREQQVTLEICPTSNFATGTLPSSQRHPLADLDRLGILMMIDCDDPALFRTDLTAEYAYVADLCGPRALLRFARQAAAASFASTHEKKQMIERIERAGAELLSDCRT